MRKKHLYITTDASDNSVTLSPALVRIIFKSRNKSPYVIVFKLIDQDCFAFKIVYKSMSGKTQCEPIRYNGKYRSYGFSSLLPTVNFMNYEMDLTEEINTLRIEKCKFSSGDEYYKIIRTYENK